MISFITREIAGWALVVAGLWVFWQSFVMLREGLILRGPPIAIMGFVIFRGGIHLLKVAIAARTSMQARRDLVEAARRTRLPASAENDASGAWVAWSGSPAIIGRP